MNIILKLNFNDKGKSEKSNLIVQRAILREDQFQAKDHLEKGVNK